MIGQSLNFCMITTFYPPYSFGGDGTYVYRLTNELAKRGHHVEVIHCADAYRVLAGREPSTPASNHPNVTVHTLRSGVGLLSPLATQQTGYPLFKARQIRAILAATPFDVIHFHNISLVGGPGILRYGRGIKLYTLHEHWLVCPMHTLWRYNRELCTRKTCIRCSLVYRRPPQWWRYSGLLERSLQHVDVFIAPSRWTLEKHRELGLALPVIHIPHFISSPEAWLNSGNHDFAAHGRPYFLFVGRLEKIKGVQSLLPVFRTYVEADLLIAGDGTHAARLKEEAADIPQVKFLGPVSSEALRSLYRHAVAVLVPSLGYETFGMVVLEAFAEGTPVITFDRSATAELVNESGGGFTYRTDAELVQAMETLRNNGEIRKDLGQCGREAFLKQWSEQPHMDRYFGLIADVARSKGLDTDRFGSTSRPNRRTTSPIEPVSSGKH